MHTTWPRHRRHDSVVIVSRAVAFCTVRHYIDLRVTGGVGLGPARFCAVVAANDTPPSAARAPAAVDAPATSGDGYGAHAADGRTVAVVVGDLACRSAVYRTAAAA